MMEPSAQSATRVTLLHRLMNAPEDPASWVEFVDWCGRRIYGWCRAWGLQDADAEDVTQEVFLNLSVRMQVFRYDPKGSFRAWLKTLTHHAWQDYLESQRKPGQGGGSHSAMARLEAIEARDDLVRRMAEAFDEESFKEAAARVRLRVDPRTWDAFQLLAIEGRSGAEVAGRLEMKVATVYVARSKVQRMLREEVRRLEPEEPTVHSSMKPGDPR
jgi:RNA polymerase sigma factor (sigma-70 family)